MEKKSFDFSQWVVQKNSVFQSVRFLVETGFEFNRNEICRGSSQIRHWGVTKIHSRS